MYKTGMHLLIYYKDVDSCASVWSPCGANWTSLLWITSEGVVCRPVSTLKADSLNFTY